MTGGPCFAAAWSIIATRAAKALSTDHRNTKILSEFATEYLAKISTAK